MSLFTLLITGGSGYLGRALVRLGVKQGFETHFTCYKADISDLPGTPHRLDLLDATAVRQVITHLRPQAIIHTAAANPGQPIETMMPLNRDGSANIAAAAGEVSARLVHVSSDVVHNGQNAPYADDTTPTPLNEYGRSKAAGEVVIRRIAPQAALVRTSLIYGLSEIDRGTAGFIDRLEQGEPLVLFTDVIRQPVWRQSLATALLKLASSHHHVAGLLNIAGEQALSRADFGLKMLDWWQYPHRNQLTTGRLAQTNLIAPLNLQLQLAKAQSTLGMRFPGVDDVLSR